MTKDEVLQKANDYCNEKGYTGETLTDEFKELFATHFSNRYPDGDINDENIIAEIQFNLNTAFSATSKGVTAKQKAYDKMVEDYTSQIEKLNKKITAANDKNKQEPKEMQIPKEVQEKLDRLEEFEIKARKGEKFKEVLALAKKGVRQDLHKSLENYAADFAVSLDSPSDEQANRLIERFQTIFRDSIGDIKPLAPKTTRKQEEDFAASLQPIKV
jgi:hypothetical protein